MGADISALLANAGFDVVVVDVDPDALDLLGWEVLIETLEDRYDETGAGVYEPAPGLSEE